MNLFQKVLFALAIFAFIVSLATIANAQTPIFTDKQFFEMFSLKEQEPILATYKGEKVQIQYRKLEDNHGEWSKILYIFFKPVTNEDWFIYQVHKEKITSVDGTVTTKVFSRIFEITKRGPVVLKGYAGTSAQESFEVMRKFVEEKFKLSIPAGTKL